MHPRVLPEPAWKLVKSLTSADVTTGWSLAGGTALALLRRSRLLPRDRILRCGTAPLPQRNWACQRAQPGCRYAPRDNG